MVQLSSLYGKDLSDSLGGAVYNATLQVDVNELDYMDSVILADGGLTTLNNSTSKADQAFGIKRNIDGSISLQPQTTEPKNIDEIINSQIEKQIQQSQLVVQQIRKDNPNTKLTNQQIRELYDDFNNGDFFIV